MFIERMKVKFKINEPILIEEILDLFSDYSKMQVYRFIREAKNKRELIKASYGVYYIPKITFLGIYSVITVDDIIEKKYIKRNDNNIGIYGGVKLLNRFGLTTQMAGAIEIVTNYETTRGRKIVIDERNFILKKSYCKITKDNYSAYTILQLFNDMDPSDKIDDSSKLLIINQGHVVDYDLTTMLFAKYVGYSAVVVDAPQLAINLPKGCDIIRGEAGQTVIGCDNQNSQQLVIAHLNQHGFTFSATRTSVTLIYLNALHRREINRLGQTS